MPKSTQKCFLFISLFPFLLSGCTTTPKPVKTVVKPPLPTLPQQAIINPQQPPPVPQPQIWLQQPPADFLVWLNRDDNKQRVAAYEKFLQANRIHTAVPTYQLLRSARDWQKCERDPYAVPSPELWGNMLPTLKIIQYLVDLRILRDFEVTSVYRDYSLNLCAGGAAGSKHVYNSAIDFRIGSTQPTTQDILLIEDTKIKLCQFWQQHGQKLNMGLGIYASGQIHIDTQGYRTWGFNHSNSTSICN